MPDRSHEWLTRIKRVEIEWNVANVALDRLQAQVSVDSTLLDQPLRSRDVRTTSERLEGTYLIRLFAEFETGLRSFWRTLRRSRPQTKGLLDGVGSRCRIPGATIDAVQQVRVFRNHLVHETSERVEELTLPHARRHLCTYFSYLPPQW